MNKTIKYLAIGLLAFFASCSSQESLIQYVDPQIGTAHSRWFFYTPAAVPFGMAKPSPTTNGHLGNPSGWEAVGYDYRDSTIEGFACFHEFQVGGLVLCPTTGDVQTVPGSLDNPESGYRSRFDKSDEIDQPGYYSVLLKDYGTTAELTSTKRVALFRFSYPKNQEANLIFNVGTVMGESGSVKDAHVEFLNDSITGWIITNPKYVEAYQKGQDVRMYFTAVVDQKPSVFGGFVNDTIMPCATESNGPGAGFYLSFEKPNKEVNVKVGLSYTSVENSKQNLTAEAKNLTFDKAKSNAQAEWENALGRLRVEGGKPEDKTKFYTGLFHALLGRGLASDVNGAYPRNDGSVGQIPLTAEGKPEYNHYNTDAIWGGFWNLTQLWTIAYPEYFADWISSQLLVYKDSGWLADGIACSRYVSGVGTNFVGLAIAAAYNCGIRNFDVAKGYEAALKNEIVGGERPLGAGKIDVGEFVKRGYVPYSSGPIAGLNETGSGFAVSHTLEYCFSSYAVAQMANGLGLDEDYELLTGLSNGWKNVYDGETKLVRPKGPDGKFIKDFDPHAAWIGFQEGNAIQYTYYVPHDPEALIDTIGREEFNNRLDSTFILSEKNVFGGGKTINAFAGLQAAYNHGNQPNLHISGMFNFSGKPWLSQKWMRAICDEFYGTEGIHGYGYGQDEDQGQLGAWYVMAAMGLFDVKGLTSPDPSFQIVSPLFDKITITLNKDYYTGDKFEIVTKGLSDANKYIKSMTLNGLPHNTIQLPLSELTKGGMLEIELSDQPNTEITR